MIKLAASQTKPQRLKGMKNRASRMAARIAVRLKVWFFTAFPMESPPDPASPSPIAKAAALREGALLREGATETDEIKKIA